MLAPWTNSNNFLKELKTFHNSNQYRKYNLKSHIQEREFTMRSTNLLRRSRMSISQGVHIEVLPRRWAFIRIHTAKEASKGPNQCVYEKKHRPLQNHVVWRRRRRPYKRLKENPNLTNFIRISLSLYIYMRISVLVCIWRDIPAY